VRGRQRRDGADVLESCLGQSDVFGAQLAAIIVMYRGAWLRRSDRPHDLGHDDWLTLAGPNGYWDDIPGEMDPEYPKPLHIEVPSRLIKLYS
jgi:hypothetical protein